jgi:AraC family transcriptional regulator
MHLQEPLSVAQVAQHVAMSEAHFQRVFHDAVGETIGQFVTRKRLETAALRLAYESETPITVIALSSGYSSSSNFGKAFSGYFGLSPSQVRNPSPELSPRLGKLLSQWGKLLQAAELYTLPPQVDGVTLLRESAYWDARVRFETSPGLSLACLASPEGYDFEAVQQTWAELIRFGRQLGICAAEVDAWGIAHDSPYLTAPERCRYYAAVPCAEGLRLPAPLFPVRIEPGRYAVFHYVGTVSGLNDAYRSIYSCWFRTSSVSPEDFRPLEHYVANEPQGDQVEMEIWFRLRPKA